MSIFADALCIGLEFNIEELKRHAREGDLGHALETAGAIEGLCAVIEFVHLADKMDRETAARFETILSEGLNSIPTEMAKLAQAMAGKDDIESLRSATAAGLLGAYTRIEMTVTTLYPGLRLVT